MPADTVTGSSLLHHFATGMVHFAGSELAAISLQGLEQSSLGYGPEI